MVRLAELTIILGDEYNAQLKLIEYQLVSL